jgi:Rit1 N-terminal domain/Rit1 DUSP-like domain
MSRPTPSPSPSSAPDKIDDEAIGSGWAQAAETALIRACTTNSLHARLRSIEHDAKAALALHAALTRGSDRAVADEDVRAPLPLFGNARAGAWYTPPSPTKRTCAFKSADGHYGQWASSPRRPNIPLLRAAIEAGGAVVVDVTRAGKVWPDALAKTLPIWCAVVSAVAGVAGTRAEEMYLHPGVPKGERAAVARMIGGWVDEWRRSGVDMRELVPGFLEGGRPVRCLWVCTEKGCPWEEGVPSVDELGYVPIVCVVASARFDDGERKFVEADADGEQQIVRGVPFPRRGTGFAYVQGAGDDEESWCCGLTPDLFWDRREEVLAFTSQQSGAVGRERQEQGAATESFINGLRRRWLLERKEHNEHGSDAGTACHEQPLFRSQLCVQASTPAGIFADAEAAASGGAALVIALSHSHAIKAAMVCVDGEAATMSDGGDDKSTKGNRSVVHWVSMATDRGKPDTKWGLCRALGGCLDLLRETLAPNPDSPALSDTPFPRAVVLCDSAGGDWAAGLAVAWLAWHCAPDQFAVLPQCCPLKTHVDKETVRGLTLRVVSQRADLAVSRRTSQQINRFFQSSYPSSSVRQQP